MSRRVTAAAVAGIMVCVRLHGSAAAQEPLPDAPAPAPTAPAQAPPAQPADSSDGPVSLPPLEVRTTAQKKKSTAAKAKSAVAGSGADTPATASTNVKLGGAAPADVPYTTPGSSAYISGDDIQRLRGTSPGDIFKDTAGVIAAESRNGGGIDVNIRGLQGYNRTAVTVDGAQSTSTIDRGYHGDANRTFIDPDFISGVSITKGPSNAPGASGAIGGHVAVSTITADDVVKPGKTWGVLIRGSGNTNSSSPPPVGTVGGIEPISGNVTLATNQPGIAVESLPSSFGDTLATGRPDWYELTGGNGSVAVATKQNNIELLAALAYRENGNYHAGTHGNYARIGQQYVFHNTFAATQSQVNLWNTNYPGHGVKVGDPIYRDTAFYGNVGEDRTRYRAGEEVLNTSLQTSSLLLKGKVDLTEESDLSLSYMRTTSRFGISWPSIDQTNAPITQNEPSTVAVDLVTMRYRYNPANNDLVHVTFNGWMSEQALTEDRAESGSFPQSTYTDADVHSFGFDLTNRSVARPAIGLFNVDYGIAYIDTVVDKQFETKIMWNSAILDHRLSADQGARRQWDLFSNVNWHPATWLEVDGGLRYMVADTSWITSHTLQAFVGSGFVLPTYHDRTDSGLSPSVGLTIKPLDGLKVYGLYKQGIRAPSFTEASDVSASTTLANVDPEVAHNYEAGVSVLTNGVLVARDTAGLKINYFYNDIDDYIFMGYAPNTLILTAYNYDSARFSGVEMSARYDSRFFFGNASAIYYDKITMCPTAAQCYDSNSDEGIPLNNWRNHVPPRYSASLTLGVHLLDQKLTLGGRATYMGDRAGIPRALETDASRKYVDTGRRWHAYEIFDLFAEYKFEDGLTLSFAAENILDTFYTDALAMANQPGPGRTLRFNFAKQF